MTNKDQRDMLYWDSKHPRVPQMYSGRPAPDGKSYSIDVRRFIWPEDNTLDKIVHDYKLYDPNPDIAAWKCQQWVVRNLKYASDTRIGRTEYWLFPVETLAMGVGDCEDGAILMASLFTNACEMKHQWRGRNAAGWVDAGQNAEQGGHAYFTYIRITDNMPVVLDWCYLEDSSVPVHEKPLIKDVSQYRDVWFSWNHRWAWSHTRFECSGRVAGSRRT